MDKKTKIFWLVMIVLIFSSVASAFYRYIIKKDYIIQAQIDCDPLEESCFVWECDPESDEEGEACTGDEEVNLWTYKIINKNASRIVSCDQDDEDCEALFCGENEPDCGFVFCNEENKEEYGSEICTYPEDYSEDENEESLGGEEMDYGDKYFDDEIEEETQMEGVENEEIINDDSEVENSEKTLENEGENQDGVSGGLPVLE